VALTLKNQATSVDINHNMLLLTRDTVDDSATVRVVTLVTMLYLPASFVSVSLWKFKFDDHLADELEVILRNESICISGSRRSRFPDIKAVLGLYSSHYPLDNLDSGVVVLHCSQAEADESTAETNRATTAAWN
jgi:hypothetical protein